jgi:hypothetical protein
VGLPSARGSAPNDQSALGSFPGAGAFTAGGPSCRGQGTHTAHTWRVSGGGFAARCRGDEGAGQTSPVTHAVSSSPSSCCPATQSITVFINIIITPVEQVLRSFPFEQLATAG